MAYALDTYTATAAQTDFTITFPYIAETHVTVYKNGVLMTNQADADTVSYQIVSSTTVRFGAGLTAGDVVGLIRSTSPSARLTDYEDASTLTETDLDNDSLQAFYMVQEALDGADEALGLGLGSVNWDAEGLLIKDVGTPVEAGDAVTKAYADAIAAAAGNVPTPDNPGDDTKVLTASGGTFTWQAASSSVITTRGDVVRGDAAGAAERLALGASGTVLTSDGTDAAWANIGTMTTQGDMIRGGASGAAERLPIGANTEILMSDGTDADWVEWSYESGHLHGALLSQDADADHDINVIGFECRDRANSANIIYNGEITKQLDATWAAGDDAGGLSSSLTAPAVDTWYHIFAIIVGGSADVGFDTDVDAANLIADHTATAYRRIGSILTDASANIIDFYMIGDIFLWKVPVQDFSDNNPGTAAVDRVLSTPLGYRISSLVAYSLFDAFTVAATYTYGLIASKDTTDTAASITVHNLTCGTGDGGDDDVGTSVIEVPTNTSSTVRSRVNRSSTNITLKGTTYGWRDNLGRMH
jgi:hypothetical protein